MFIDTFKKTCQHNTIDLHPVNPDQAGFKSTATPGKSMLHG
jgi:hypothetical protein